MEREKEPVRGCSKISGAFRRGERILAARDEFTLGQWINQAEVQIIKRKGQWGE